MSSTAFLLKIKLAFGISLILVVTVGMASFFTINRLIEAAQSRFQTEDTVVLLERVAISIKAIESAAQQYLLSGTVMDLQAYQQMRIAAREAIGRIRKASLLPEQASLDELVAQRRMLADQTIAARQSAGREAGLAIYNSDLSRQLRQRTDGLLETARKRETLALQNAQVAAQRSAQWSELLIIAGALSLMGMLAWVVFVVKHYEAARKTVEAQLRDSEIMSRSIAESIAQGVITTDAHDIVLEANAAALQLFGYEKSELIGRHASDLVPERLRRGYKDFMAALRAQPEAFKVADRETRCVRKDGSEFPISVSVGDVQVGGRRLFTALIHDNTESKRITEALYASELQLRQITDTVPALIAHLDLEQRFRFHNKAYEEVFGLSFEQIDGHTLVEVLGQQAYGAAQGKVEEVLRGYPVGYEHVQITPQGKHRNYAMQYVPRYGEGADKDKVIGFFALGTDITKLKRIDRMKTEFVSTVSHELRTPLTSIRGSLGLISGGVAGELPEAVKNLVGIAKNNCERLIRLINDILDSEKIESGKMRLDLQVVDIQQLVRQALVANEGFAGQHRVTVLLQAPDAPLKVRIDRDRMTQVLTNLLSNAVKFSPPESAVEVKVSRAAQGVRVEVADHGPGIPEEFRGRIFQKFSQADASDTRQKGGTGLGLSISRALIEKMGGQIGFSGEAGAGTTFFFELPEWQDPVPLPQPFRAKAVSSRPRILICEDDPDVARLISMMLGKAGFEADMAHSAEQALVCLARSSYAAVTVDLKLPGQNGLAFISALRGDERTRKLPVVVVSAMAAQGRLQFSRKPLMVSDWLEKPIDEDLLILSVRRAIAGLRTGKPHILHVEDDPDVQRITAAIAREFAHFEFAATLDEARAWLREQRFDLVLLDLALGEDSGWDLVEDIDALDPRPPVIVFS
ncbi:MAG: PAS domain S-box protein, partial [Polaromonas sp.]